MRMNRIIVAVLALFTKILFGATEIPPTGEVDGGWDVAKEDVYSLDLGSSAPYQQLPFRVLLKNSLDHSLQVLNIESSCGCTEGKIEWDAEISKWVLSGSVSTVGSAGNYPNKIVIEWKSDDISQKSHLSILRLKTFVYKVVDESATSIDFGVYDTSSSRPVYREIEFSRSSYGPKWNNLVIDKDIAGIDAKKWKISKDKWRVGIMACPNKLPLGAYSDILKIKLLNNENIISVNFIQLIGYGRGNFEVQPAVIYGLIKDIESSSSTVEIKGGVTTPKLFDHPQVKGANDIVVKNVTSAGKSLLVELGISDKRGDKSYSGSLVIKLKNDSNLEEPYMVSIPFVFN